MDTFNKGTSVYHKIRAVFCRSNNGDLIHASGKDAGSLRHFWPNIIESLESRPDLNDCEQLVPIKATDKDVPSLKLLNDHGEDSVSREDQSSLELRQLYRKEQNQFIGLVIESPSGEDRFTEWFVTLVLRQSRLSKPLSPDSPSTRSANKIIFEVIRLFDALLRNTAPGDKWVEKGRAVFTEQVRWFVARNTTIEFCLPAFPCKSSNTDKVNGRTPDKGEEMSLKRLNLFAKQVAELYPPGAKIWIVSDGHVFSDCIGVKDETVNDYNGELMKMHRTNVSAKDIRSIGFLGLQDLFFDESYCKESFKDDMIDETPLNHPLDLPVEPTAETCRKILMAGCKIEDDTLRLWINKHDPSITALYRGFSRFMMEDLAQHPVTSGLTKKKCKKLAAEVALEMISRNQAYSNLIELLFPCHIRLSIHAHKNDGPKFGVQLLSGDCQTVDSFEGFNDQNTADLLHIPTPWHNAACYIQGDPKMYIVKSNVVRDAIDSGKFVGGWVPPRGKHGGFFELRKRPFAGAERLDQKLSRLRLRKRKSSGTQQQLQTRPTLTNIPGQQLQCSFQAESQDAQRPDLRRNFTQPTANQMPQLVH